jgi:spermidine/putrescine transport system permease protein/putrescine transport system permease protein
MRGRSVPGSRAPLLATWTIAYFAWSLAPVALLVRFSLADPSGFPAAQRFSLDWYRDALTDPDTRGAFLHSLELAVPTAVVATGLGVCLGVGLGSWTSRWSMRFRVLALAPMALPQIVLATGFFYAFLHPLGAIGFGRDAQLIAHITIALPYVVLLTWARLFSLPPELEESAVDLGASRASASIRVTLPLLLPAILAGMALAFVLSFDNLVVSQLLCIRDCTTVPMLLYGRGRAVSVSPGLVALGTISAAATLVAISIFLAAWRLGRRWQLGGGA